MGGAEPGAVSELRVGKSIMSIIKGRVEAVSSHDFIIKEGPAWKYGGTSGT